MPGPCLDFGFQYDFIKNNWSKKIWVRILGLAWLANTTAYKLNCILCFFFFQHFWARCASERSYNPLSWICCDFSPKIALNPWKLEISSIRTQNRLIEDNWGHSEDTWGHSGDTWGHLRSLKETQRIFWGTIKVFHHVLDYFII